MVGIKSQKTCCVRELNTDTVTDVLNATEGNPPPAPPHPTAQHRGVAIYFLDAAAFPQPLSFPDPLLYTSSVAFNTLPYKSMSGTFTCLLQLVGATDAMLQKITKELCVRLNAVAAALEILQHSL